MEELAVAIEGITKANNAFRDLIERGADEVGQLEKFEKRFKTTKDKFQQFKDMTRKIESQSDELIACLNQSLLEHRQRAEDSRRQIVSLKHSIEQQNTENQRLEHELTDNVERLHKLQNSDHLNVYHMNKPPTTIIERLRDDVR